MTLENVKSLLGNDWKFISPDERTVELAVQKHNIPYLLAKILISRGIGVDEIPPFLEPKLQNLMPNPSSLQDMDKAAKRIAECVTKQQKVGIIGDYDVDGATSSSLLRLFLEEFGCEVFVHIPEREEGYGPSVVAVDKFISLGVDLVVSVDCGTTAFEVFEYAKEKGVTVIVLDHHEAEIKLPPVYALVNPKRLDDNSSVRYLAAVGVVFLTIVAVNRELKECGFYQFRNAPDLLKWLDLVALGTVCDVVPLVALNRAFVRQGLKVFSLRNNIGLRALVDKAAISEQPSSYHLGYVLGPRINAGGRVGDSSLGSRLLACKDAQQAMFMADKLEEFNFQRKEIEAYVMLNAIEILEGTPQEYPIAFVSGSDWHQGVIGIVAGKLKERYNLPSFVMSIEADEVKGSARSIAGLDLGALIIAAKEKGILTKGGGHIMAAGFSLVAENIAKFRDFAGEYVLKSLGKESLSASIEIDGVIDLAAATTDMAEKLELLEPYGAGNCEPRFMISRAKVAKSEVVGSGHVRCFLNSLNGGNIKAMAFRAADNEVGKALLESRGEVFNLVGTLRRDNWMGRNSLQFIIEDAMRIR